MKVLKIVYMGGTGVRSILVRVFREGMGQLGVGCPLVTGLKKMSSNQNIQELGIYLPQYVLHES